MKIIYPHWRRWGTRRPRDSGTLQFEWSHPVVYLYIHFITIYYRQHNYNRI